MKKRLFVLKSLGRGGAELYLLSFLRYYRDISKNYVLLTSGVVGPLESEFESVCTIVSDFKLEKNSLREYRAFASFLKSENITTICDFRGNFSGLVLAVAKIVGVPIRLAFYRESVNQYVPNAFKDFYAWLMKIIMMSSATKILSNSYAALSHFHPNYVSKPELYRVVYNGFLGDRVPMSKRNLIRTSLGIPETAFVIGHVGRLTPAKNHEMIIKCAEAFCSIKEDAYFLLVGRDVDSEYSQVIKEIGLEGRVVLTGAREDIPNLLVSMDVFLFPSLNEGQPNALIEAMCNGIPFVASAIPSIMETCDGAPCGELVNPMSLNDILRALDAFYTRRIPRDMSLSEWALSRFDPNKWFSAFEEEL